MSLRSRYKGPVCCLCGTRKNVEHHHVGGRNHLPWYTVPLCSADHRQCHLLLKTGGVDLEYTSDPIERLCRARKAISIFQCMFEDAMHENHRAAS